MRDFEMVDYEKRVHKDRGIRLPQRSSEKSAGYDFFIPTDLEIKPRTYSNLIFTDIKVRMEDDEVLLLFVRSSVGIKKRVTLANNTGIIDADYYSNKDNDGNIGFVLYNNSDKTVKFNAGDKVIQGVFLKYQTTDLDTTETNRVGGFGSTN